MHYYIDGYNFLFRLQGKAKTALERKRQSLIDLLNEELSSAHLHVSIIFDSSEQIKDYAQSFRLSHLEIIYAPRNQTADEYIVELIENKKNPKMYTVVTSDTALARECKQNGTYVLSIEEFSALIVTKKQKKQKSSLKSSHKEVPSQMKRLLQIFEERLKED